jgi:hypothetical protein
VSGGTEKGFPTAPPVALQHDIGALHRICVDTPTQGRLLIHGCRRYVSGRVYPSTPMAGLFLRPIS